MERTMPPSTPVRSNKGLSGMGRLFQWLVGTHDEAMLYERLKLVLLSSCFFFIIATYSILKPFKNAVFVSLIGTLYLPRTKYISILLMIPAMYCYSLLVDRVRRYQIAYFFFTLYAILSLVFAYFLAHPVIGLANTAQNPWRILGWVFYVAMDFFPVLIVSTFWAFSNSISTPDSAKKQYGILVAASKVAGVLSPLISLYVIEYTGIPFQVGMCALLMLLAALSMVSLIRHVPGRFLHGYEAVYKLEKERSKELAKRKGFRGFVDGFRLMITQPYLFGIFGLVYSYEIISAMLDYQRLYMAELSYHNSVISMGKFELVYTAAFQGLGLCFALFGTAPLLRYFDVQRCLISVPVVIATVLVTLKLYPTLTGVFVAMVVLRALNYGFNVPIREILYIPTVKDIKFKSKAWIDSFGRTFSKTSGATINILTQWRGPAECFAAGNNFSLLIAGVWLFLSIGVSRKYMDTVRRDETIGDE